MNAAPGAPSRVLVNLLWLVPGVVGGSEDSVTGALRAVAQEPPADLRIRLAVLEPFLEAHPDLAIAFPCSVLALDGRRKARRVLAEQTWLAREARRRGARVVHHAGGVVPLVHPGRSVLTIHDLQPLDLPVNFSRAKRTYVRAMAGRSARVATRVCVPSEFTRRRVVDLLGVDPDKIDVVPWFARPAAPTAAEAPVDAPPEVTGGRAPGEPASSAPSTAPEQPYLLYPAITYPHKNHTVLLDAFAAVAAADPDARLVLTGGEGPEEARVRARIEAPDLRGRVVRTGRVRQPELDDLYRNSAGVVVPSRYEGFGLPALEAMQRGCPVVVADAGSLPEVARPDDLVDPDDVTAWTTAMQCVLRLSPEERSRRTRAGLERAARFTPAATASGLLHAYRRAAAN